MGPGSAKVVDGDQLVVDRGRDLGTDRGCAVTEDRKFEASLK